MVPSTNLYEDDFIDITLKDEEPQVKSPPLKAVRPAKLHEVPSAKSSPQKTVRPAKRSASSTDYAPITAPLHPINRSASPHTVVLRTASPKIDVPWGVDALSIPVRSRVLFIDRKDGNEAKEAILTGGGKSWASLQYGDPVSNIRKSWADIKLYPE